MRIGFIGGGKMAEAMIAGMMARNIVRPGDILAADISEERRAWLSRQHGISATAANKDVIAHGLVLVLAVKPQQLADVLRELAPIVTSGHLVMSIAAGRATDWIEERLPKGRVVRVMPNIACLAGEGMSVFTRGSRATEGDATAVRGLLECCGRTMELPEPLFDSVTALSGSGPAFFAYLLDRLVDGAVREGLPRKEALLLAAQTMLGTARLLLDKGIEPADLAASVTSAKGTTAEGRKELETDIVAEALRRTISAATRRSRELSRG